MKKIWYLSNADKKDKRVARLFVYENNGQQKAQLDLMSFSDKPDFSRVDVCFYVPQEITVKKMRCQPEDAFIKQALHGKGILPDDCMRHIEGSVRNLQLRIIWGGKAYDSFSCKEDLPPEAEQETVEETNREIVTAETAEKANREIMPAEIAEETKHEITKGSEGDCGDDRSEYAADQTMDVPKSEQEAPKEMKESKQESSVGFRLGDDSDDSLDDGLGDDSGAAKEDETHRVASESPKEGARRIVELGVLEEEMIFRSFVHNSFLLHGYYNYGHLIIDEKNGSARLGVPGNYYEREKAVASMFGFPDFEPAKDKIVGNGTFGYYFTAYT